MIIEFLSQEFYMNTVWTWIVALLYFLGAILVGRLLSWFIAKIVRRMARHTKTKLDDIAVDALGSPLVLAITLLGMWVGIQHLNMTESVSVWFERVYTVMLTLNFSWFLVRILTGLLTEYVEPLTKKTKSDLDDQLFPVLKKGIRVVIWVLGVIVALNNAGYDVGALIAGLGIGGLALAMAAQDSVKNFFGALTIFTDKPFKVGDRVRLGGYDGFITEIGLRSFHLKTLAGTDVIIPNSQVTDGIIENVEREPARKIELDLGLVYDTTPEQLQLGMDILHEIAQNHPHVDDGEIVSFMSFGDFSLGIHFIYYIRKMEDIYMTQSEVNMEILARFNAARLSFAFPTQTLYVKKNNS